MTTHSAYDLLVEHRPRFLDQGLPADGELTPDTLRAFSGDPWWTYELMDGALLVSSEVRSFTWDNLQTFPDHPQWKYELIDGVLIVSRNAPALRHQACVLSLGMLLRAACPPHLQTVIAPFEYAPEDEAAVQPDVLMAQRPIAEQGLRETPLLVVEVLSRTTRTLDLSRKWALYQRRGVEHYWIVDPNGPSIEALRLVDGVYEIAAKREAGQLFEVSEPVALSFDPQELLDD